uniref:Uncharacterized protein n=1 Tax=Mycolicibacterium mucogenicum DSM 44124 TaxID=1226753 RepID=A0A8H2JEK1_MYCMU
MRGDGCAGGVGIMAPDRVHDRFVLGDHVGQIVTVHRLAVTQAQPGHQVGQGFPQRRIVRGSPKHFVPLRIQLACGGGILRRDRLLVQFREVRHLQFGPPCRCRLRGRLLQCDADVIDLDDIVR